LPITEIHELFPGMQIKQHQRLHPIYATRILRHGRILTEIWGNLPGLPKTHSLILLLKP
jgi:hypothetical protein